MKVKLATFQIAIEQTDEGIRLLFAPKMTVPAKADPLIVGIRRMYPYRIISDQAGFVEALPEANHYILYLL